MTALCADTRGRQAGMQAGKWALCAALVAAAGLARADLPNDCLLYTSDAADE